MNDAELRVTGTGFSPMEVGALDMVVERVGDLAAHAASQWGDIEAARLGETAYTFRQLEEWSTAIAVDLVQRGVTPGDTFLILMVNRLEVIAATMAAWRIGAIAVPVVAIYRTHEMSEIIADCRPAAVLTTATLGDRQLAAEIDSCLRESGTKPRVKYIADGADGLDGWTVLPDSSSTADRSVSLPEPSAPLEECLRLYTSGSTSAPKGVRLNSPAVIFGGRQFNERIGIGPGDVGIAVAPVAHIAGMLAAAIVPLTCGAGAVILPRWDVAEAVRLIDTYHVTWSLGAAVFLVDLVNAYEALKTDGMLESTHVLTYYVSGGANTAPEVIERANAIGMWAARTYGMTEAAGVVTLAAKDASLERLSRWDGKLADNAEIRVVDDEGNVLPPETEGNIWIKSAQLLLGYTDPTLNETQFRDGWFDVGDIGMVSADRWMRITGRSKDIINRGGEKFSAADIEHVIARHPEVARAAVVGVPDDRLGECVCAFVVAKPGAELDPDGLVAFMKSEDIARVKIPVEWHFISDLPTTASGKIQKHILRAERDAKLASAS